MSSSSCVLDKPTLAKTTTTDTEVLVKETDFIIGSCSSFDSLPIDQPMDALLMPTTTPNNGAYADCVRLLTRKLRQSPKLDRNLQCDDDGGGDVGHSSSTSTDDDWNEQYVRASKGIPELLALQNTIIQLQHAFHLMQQEANTAVHDASVAMQSSQYWKSKYYAAKQSVISLEQDNQVLKQQSEALIANKRKLKAACKKLLTQQHDLQSQQVESYVVSALAAHEQFLHGPGASACKNRSRTTTLDTTGTSAGDDFTALDDPFTNSPNNTFESSDGNHSPKVSVEVVECNTTSTTAMCTVSTPPTIETMKEHNQQNQTAQHRGMNGFGNACHAFGRTFKFIDNHVHRKEQRAIAAENQMDGIRTNNDCVPPVDTATLSTYSPILHDRPYAPIRFDVITPTRSEDSNDSVKAHRRKMHSSRSPPGNKPLIDVTTLLEGPIEDSNDHIERTFHKPISDQLLLSLPLLPVSCGTNIAGSLKSVSPISIPEEEEETLYSHEHTSALRIKCQRYSCDPSLLRSLSVPTIPLHAQPPPSTPPDLNTRQHC